MKRSTLFKLFLIGTLVYILSSCTHGLTSVTNYDGPAIVKQDTIWLTHVTQFFNNDESVLQVDITVNSFNLQFKGFVKDIHTKTIGLNDPSNFKKLTTSVFELPGSSPNVMYMDSTVLTVTPLRSSLKLYTDQDTIAIQLIENMK